MPVLAFRCRDGHLTERLVRGGDLQEIACESCLEPALRQSVYAITVTGAARVPLDQRQVKIRDFQEASAELAYKHEQAESAAGEPLPKPPLWKIAKREARRLRKLGAKDSSDLK